MQHCNRNVWHTTTTFSATDSKTGKDNATIGSVFVDLIDDAFQNYRRFQDSDDIAQYMSWANDFKSRLNNALS